MIELKHEEFSMIYPLLKGLLKYNYILRSVIDGSVAGRVFVDDAENPKTVLLWDKTDCAGIYIEGEYSPEIAKAMNNLIREKIIPEANTIEDTKDIASCYSPIDVWEDKMVREVFAGLFVMKSYRKFLIFDKGKNKILNWEKLVPDNFKMVRFSEDVEMLKNQDIKNADQLVHRISYSKPGFGCCLIDKKVNEIASVCFSDWSSDVYLEVGIKTEEKYRKRGFAAVTTAAMIEFALERGIEHIGWHLWDGNIGSEYTAIKAGFRMERRHVVYHFWYNEFDNLHVNLRFYFYEQRDYNKVLFFLRKIRELEENNTESYKRADFISDEYKKWLLYVEASCMARLGDLNAIIIRLNQLIEIGLHNKTGFIQFNNIFTLSFLHFW
ncbi:hypothetical protein LCGC14_0546360 [marine sediment metagenome]|uniref:N-acetyltransferase domain-containing protein n=1 Tax=marine sediment metagenome TaxID=412755 RepID=A0A0F9UCN3_9ZZZZ|nr:GNAT family N-acetyltransferase [bacterium]